MPAKIYALKVYTYRKKAGVSKHSSKKILQFLWKVVTYLLKNVKHEFEHDIDSTGDIRHS